MKIIIIGSGGRENIISEKLSKGNEIYCISSWINPDICSIAKDYGITEMIRDGLIENIPDDFKPLQSQNIEGETIYSVHPKVEQYVNQFASLLVWICFYVVNAISYVINYFKILIIPTTKPFKKTLELQIVIVSNKIN